MRDKVISFEKSEREIIREKSNGTVARVPFHRPVCCLPLFVSKCWLTCSTDPVHVSVHLHVEPLLLLELEEAGPALHSVLLLGKLSRWVDSGLREDERRTYVRRQRSELN